MKKDVSGAGSGLDKVAMITGAGSGIGRAVALAMQSAGYSVVLAGRRIADLEQTAAMADDKVGKMLPCPPTLANPMLYARYLQGLAMNSAGWIFSLTTLAWMLQELQSKI